MPAHENPLRLGVIGCGPYWSTRMHLPAMQRVATAENVRYVAVCDLDKPAAELYARQLGAETVHTDAADMLDRHALDGVVIVVNVPTTPAMIELAATRRIPFLVEKPPASSVEVHQRLIAVVGNLPHIVAYNRRHAPYIVQAKTWTADQPIQAVTGLFTRHRRLDPDFSTTAVHAIDTIRHLAGGDLATARLDVVKTPTVFNYFLTGYTAANTRVDLVVTPDTASAREHYTLSPADKNVAIAYPPPPMIDLPGYVEGHERNRNIRRLTPTSFGLAADVPPALAGIVGEHTRFCGILRGRARAISTLDTYLQNQQIRQAITELKQAEGGGISMELE